MNDGFKQRLVGAVVLGSLGLILWPIIFSQTTGPAVDKRSQIPPPPSFEKYTVSEPKREPNIQRVNTGQGNELEIQNDPPKKDSSVISKTQTKSSSNEKSLDKSSQTDTAVNVSDTSTSTKSTSSKKSPETPKVDRNGLPISWVLQVASFKKESNATQLKDALVLNGYKAYTQRVKKNNVESIRVYVGPKFTQAALTKDKKTIDEAFKVQSLVVRFVP